MLIGDALQPPGLADSILRKPICLHMNRGHRTYRMTVREVVGHSITSLQIGVVAHMAWDNWSQQPGVMRIFVEIPQMMMSVGEQMHRRPVGRCARP